jgi:asparagine synthase (glutamine-hydrolysing)
MPRALSFRAADAEGQHVEPGLLLGVRSRQFCVGPAGVLPFRDARSGVLCLFDGRLDGRAALLERLGLADDPALPDEAVVAAAYGRWGEAFVHHLSGDFALALWDPARHKLLLARDPLGMRALYLARTPDTLLFASQARALFAHPEVSRSLDELRIAQYLARCFVDTTRTFFRGVSRLAPGHLLVATGGAVDVRRTFSLDPDEQLPAQSSAAYAEQFRALFLDAVRTRMRTPRKLGCFLSGGLDSTGVYGALKQLEPERPVACFSARFLDFPEVDEGSWLALVPRHAGDERHELRADRLGPLDDVDRLHQLLDEPFHAPNLFLYVALARLAQQRGAPVLLDGLDGDTVVDHGFAHLRELLWGGRLRRLARALRAIKRRTGLPYRTLLHDALGAPAHDCAQALLSRYGLARRGFLARDFARASGFCAEQRQHWEAQLARPTLRAAHHAALTDPILPFYFEVHDKLAAALDVEHRHPYFDLRLVRFCLALPAEQRLHDGWDRVVQRRAFAGLAPDPIRARQSKSVWSANFERQLFACHGERMRGLVQSKDSPLKPYCDLERMARLLATRDRPEGSESILDLWCAVTLGAWLQQVSAIHAEV